MYKALLLSLIRLVTTTNGKNVDLSSKNLRIIVKGSITEIHYAFEKPLGRPCGTEIAAVDKGYSEAFVDSDGDQHCVGLGKIMTEYSDKASKTNKSRNKLYALEQNHREAGRISKADRIRNNNLDKKPQRRLGRRDPSSFSFSFAVQGFLLNVYVTLPSEATSQ